MALRHPTDPDVTIPELVSRLTDDSRRLARNEVRLARMEVGDAVHVAGRGMLWLAIAFGVLVIAFVALTIFLATGSARLLGVPIWTGTMIAGALLLLMGGLLAYGGFRILKDQPYTLDETREEAKNTARWVKGERERVREFDPLGDLEMDGAQPPAPPRRTTA